MVTIRTDWHDAPTPEAWQLLAAESAFPQPHHPPHVRWPVLLGWGGLLLGAIAVWGLAALGLGRLTGWW